MIPFGAAEPMVAIERTALVAMTRARGSNRVGISSGRMDSAPIDEDGLHVRQALGVMSNGSTRARIEGTSAIGQASTQDLSAHKSVGSRHDHTQRCRVYGAGLTFARV